MTELKTNLIKLQVPPSVIEAYFSLKDVRGIEPLPQGLINKTYLLKAVSGDFILQRLSPIFSPAVHFDIEKVTRTLQSKDIFTPLLIPTKQKSLFTTHEAFCFRVFSYVAGTAYSTVANPMMAEQAGLMLGRFHRALLELDYEYQSQRIRPLNFPHYEKNLKEALANQAEHTYFDKVFPLGEAILARMKGFSSLAFSQKKRNIHGDPKISNIIFSKNGHALCLVDLDTVGIGYWPAELADALRSWSNPRPEDDCGSRCDAQIARAALSGYASIMKEHWTKDDIQLLVPLTQAITLCLASRYAADVLNESYFGYDQSRFSRAAEHNMLRAQAQWSLYRDFHRQQLALEKIVSEAFQ